MKKFCKKVYSYSITFTKINDIIKGRAGMPLKIDDIASKLNQVKKNWEKTS